MRSPNFTVFLLFGFYLSLFLFHSDVATILRSRAMFFGICATFLPITLLVRRRYLAALSLVVMTILFAVTMLIIRQNSISIDAIRSMIDDPPVSAFVFLILLLPGLFLVSELDAERLPHEFSSWSGLRIFRPLIAVFATRERVLRRLSAIRETCQLRGIALDSRFQHLRTFCIWIVPLATATICEAAYAYKFREMLGSAHHFVPTQPKKPVLSPIQRVWGVLLLMAWLFGIQRFARIWITIS